MLWRVVIGKARGCKRGHEGLLYLWWVLPIAVGVRRVAPSYTGVVGSGGGHIKGPKKDLHQGFGEGATWNMTPGPSL